MERRKGGFRRKKVCQFCAEKVDFVDYKDTETLKKYITERGKILPKRIRWSELSRYSIRRFAICWSDVVTPPSVAGMDFTESTMPNSLPSVWDGLTMAPIRSISRGCGVVILKMCGVAIPVK